MNRLNIQERAKILGCLVEGNSIICNGVKRDHYPSVALFDA